MAPTVVQEPLLRILKVYWPVLVSAFLVSRCIYRRYFHPLSKVPGPFWGSITGLYWLYVFFSGTQNLTQIELHAKYGSIVRIRPDGLIINHPKYFGPYWEWDKSEFWNAFKGHPTILPHGAELDVEKHKQKKRKIMGGYTMSQVLKNESSMDKQVMAFMDQMKKRCNVIFDIAPWAQFAAFDVAMEMMFTEPAGFLKEGRDVDGLIGSLRGLFTFVGVLGLYPWLSRIMFHRELLRIPCNPKTQGSYSYSGGIKLWDRC
jgi:hypothetical protein